MAESAFEKLASAEAEAEKIRQTGAENQREQLKRAKLEKQNTDLRKGYFYGKCFNRCVKNHS